MLPTTDHPAPPNLTPDALIQALRHASRQGGDDLGAVSIHPSWLNAAADLIGCSLAHGVRVNPLSEPQAHIVYGSQIACADVVALGRALTMAKGEIAGLTAALPGQLTAERKDALWREAQSVSPVPAAQAQHYVQGIAREVRALLAAHQGASA